MRTVEVDDELTEEELRSIIFSPEDQARMIADLLPAVPRSGYHEYINSQEWKDKAERFKEKTGNRCQLCHVSGYAVPLHVHHNNYYHLGNERDTDLVVLCKDCHKMFHDSGIGYQREVKLTKEQFSIVLKNAGVTYTNDDPWHYYEIGKAIINHINDCLDTDLYDYYNSVNREICDAAITNQDRRYYELAKASGNWNGYYNERDWREANDYWEGWR